jgi:hypothetical protein
MEFEFAEEVENKLICPICTEPFNECVEINCTTGFHRFCRECLSNWLKVKSNCPICRRKTNSNDMVPVRFADEMIRDLKVICPNECNFIFTIEELPNHLKKCENNLRIISYEEDEKITQILKYRCVDDQVYLQLLENIKEPNTFQKALLGEAKFKISPFGRLDLEELVSDDFKPKSFYDFVGVALAYDTLGMKQKAEEMYLKKIGYYFCQFRMACLYDDDKNIEFQRNMDISNYYLCLSAEQGFFMSQCRLAINLMNGNGIEKNERVALELFRLSSIQSYPIAQYYLGIYFSETICNPYDAVFQFKESAKNGFQLSQNSLFNFLVKLSNDEVFFINESEFVKKNFFWLVQNFAHRESEKYLLSILRKEE